MVSQGLLVAFLLLLKIDDITGLVFTSCGAKETDDCRCYSNLVSTAISDDRNHYNMQKSFFPPNKANPVVVEITYNFSLNASPDDPHVNKTETWLWTESTFYLLQPIESLQFTSLLFTDSQLRKVYLTLYLPPSCYKEDDVERDERMQLFTQRLKLYAMRQSVTALIDGQYNPKAESLNTIKRYYRGQSSVPYGDANSIYALCFQILFPIFLLLSIITFFNYILNIKELEDIESNQSGSTATSTESDQSGSSTATSTESDQSGSSTATSTKQGPKFSIETMNEIIMCICSCNIVLYVLGLDIAALIRTLDMDIGIIYPRFTNPNFEGDDKLQFGIVPTMLTQDIIIILFTVVLIIIKLLLKNKVKCAYVLIGPVLCITVHSFHILVGFIHTTYHATSILVLYSVAFFVYIFALRSSFHLIAKMYCKCWSCSKLKDTEYKYWKPGGVCSYVCIIILEIILSCILFVVFAAIYLLLLFVPINLATEDGPTQIRGISAIIITFIGAAGVYKLFIKPQKTNIHIQTLINAKNREDSKDNPKWKSMPKKGKEEAIEDLIYNHFKYRMCMCACTCVSSQTTHATCTPHTNSSGTGNDTEQVDATSSKPLEEINIPIDGLSTRQKLEVVTMGISERDLKESKAGLRQVPPQEQETSSKKPLPKPLPNKKPDHLKKRLQ